MDQLEVIPLSEGQLAEAANALALAFQTDPLQSYVLPDPLERAALSPAHFAALLRYGLRFGEVFTTRNPVAGAAVWLGPGAWEVTPERAEAAGLDRLPAEMGPAAWARFEQVLGFLEPFHHRDVDPAHWYVMVVGIAPRWQGRGLGRALLQPILDRADAAGEPCYLETAQSGNVPFYEKLGFRVLVDTVEPQSGLRLWTFQRDPQQSKA